MDSTCFFVHDLLWLQFRQNTGVSAQYKTLIRVLLTAGIIAPLERFFSAWVTGMISSLEYLFGKHLPASTQVIIHDQDD